MTAQMTVGDGRLVTIDSEGMRLMVDERMAAIREADHYKEALEEIVSNCISPAACTTVSHGIAWKALEEKP